MQKMYKSKVSYGFLLGILVFLIVIHLIIFFDKGLSLKGILIITAINGATFAFVLHVFLSTNYIIESTSLKIKCGFLFNKRILIKDIHTIVKTSSLLSSPAASITDRIELKYQNHGTVIISPKHKKEFVADLLKVNPDIKVNLETL